MSTAQASNAIRPGVVVAATLDSKSEQISFLRDALNALGIATIIVDCGVLGETGLTPTISRAEVAAAAGAEIEVLRTRRDRALAIATMVLGLQEVMRDLLRRNLVLGYLGVGGGTNAALAAAAFQVMPFGLPKVLLSTNASGQTRPIVGTKDVVLINSVVDVLGLNPFLRDMLGRSAVIMAGQLRNPPAENLSPREKCSVAITTFGCTTQAAEIASELLNAAGHEVLGFHARGTGGEAAEVFLREGRAGAILDLTTTEIADEVVGGVGSAGPTRLTTAGALGIPQLVLPGALDVINFGPPETVPAKFAGRTLLAHTPIATLMRSSPEENVGIAEVMAERLNRAQGPVAVLLPMQGFSAYDHEGAPFHDPIADTAFCDALTRRLDSHIMVEVIDAHINDFRTMDRAVAMLLGMLG